MTTNYEDKTDGVNAIMCKNCTRYSKTQNNKNSILKCKNYKSSFGVGTINRIAEIDAYKDLISKLISNGKEIFKDN